MTIHFPKINGFNGGSGGGGGSSATTINFFDNITGSTLDTQLTLGNAVMVFKNGVLLQDTEDYSISGSTITFVTALVSTDKVAVINGNLSAIDLTPYRKKAETVTIDTATVIIDEVKANKNYVFSNANITSITLGGSESSMDETTIEFSCGSVAPTLDVTNFGVTWVDASAPILNANKSYIILIFNKLAFVREY